MAEFKEEDHPRDDDGKFAVKGSSGITKEEAMEMTADELERRIKTSRANVPLDFFAKKEERFHDFPEIKCLYDFNRLETSHHKKHAKEFGLSLKEYQKAAQEFFEKGNWECYYSRYIDRVYFRGEGLTLYANRDGRICTFYKENEKILPEK